MLLPLHGLLLLLHATLTSSCASRTIYKPRPQPIETTTVVPEATTTTTTTTTTPRPNITFPIFSCPPTYAAWYCLNDATCFSVEIHNQVLYNCECAIGFVGPRCEYKEIDGSYLPTRQRVLLEKASIVSGATLALLLMLLCCFMLYVRREAREKQEKIKLRPGECDEMSMESHDNEGMDEVDAICGPACSSSRMPLRPFGPHHYKVLPMSAVFKR